MPRAAHRPKALDGETKSLNVIFTLDKLAQIIDHGETTKATKGQVVRDAVDLYFEGPLQTETVPAPFREGGYAEGVRAAALMIAKNSRLTVKMASGGTMGEDIANRILKDLLD